MAQARVVEVTVGVDESGQERHLAEVSDGLAAVLAPEVFPATDGGDQISTHEDSAVGKRRTIHGDNVAGAQEHDQST